MKAWPQQKYDTIAREKEYEHVFTTTYPEKETNTEVKKLVLDIQDLLADEKKILKGFQSDSDLMITLILNYRLLEKTLEKSFASYLLRNRVKK